MSTKQISRLVKDACSGVDRPTGRAAGATFSRPALLSYVAFWGCCSVSCIELQLVVIYLPSLASVLVVGALGLYVPVRYNEDNVVAAVCV